MTQPTDPDLSIRELQATVDAWIRDVGVRYFSEMTNLAILMEEVGELARIFARSFGDQSFKKDEASYNLPDELADILFVLVCLANQTGVDLQVAMEANLAKKTQRDALRHRNNPKLKPADSSPPHASQTDETP
jgi:NTP pyrophosphatase (non-canonical NTP hydrolase)